MMEDDPHLWLDPTRYALHAERVRDGLVQADPVGASTYDANLSTLQYELSALGAEMEQGLAVCDRNTVVVSHAAYGHLTRRFGLNQIAITGVSPEVEPSTARVRAVIEQALIIGATHVLYEPLVTPRIAQTIAAEAELELLPLDPVERLTEEQVSANVDYFSVMRDNLVSLRTALGCQ
jgi:zinc transport system substrate-binding protein